MNTTATIKTSTSVTAVLQGDSPIFGGALSFTSQNVKDQNITGSHVFSKRLTYSDLTVAGSARTFIIYFEDISNQLNLAGVPAFIGNDLKTVYVKSNTAMAVTGSTPVPPVVAANTEVLINGEIELSPLLTEYGEHVIKMEWTQSALDSTGASNFYCDLIIG